MDKNNKTEKLIRYIESDGSYFEKKKLIDSLVTDDGFLFLLNKLKVSIFIEEEFPDIFTWSEQGKMNKLRHYILHDNQLLVYRKNKELRPIGVKEMSKIFKNSESQIRKLIKKMLENNVIKKVIFDNKKYYAFNPIYGMKNKRLTLTTYLWFKKELDPYLSGWMKNKILKQINELQVK